MNLEILEVLILVSAITILSILFAGDPDLMDSIIALIGRM